MKYKFFNIGNMETKIKVSTTYTKKAALSLPERGFLLQFNGR